MFVICGINLTLIHIPDTSHFLKTLINNTIMFYCEGCISYYCDISYNQGGSEKWLECPNYCPVLYRTRVVDCVCLSTWLSVNTGSGHCVHYAAHNDKGCSVSCD